MSATRTLNLAGGCLLGSILFVGCGETGMDAPLAASSPSPAALSSAVDFCDGPSGSGTWLEGADFCDDFRDGADTRWIPQGGLWEVSDNQYVGTGVQTACATGFSTNETLVRDLQVADVELRVDMRSQQRVDKGIVLRSTGPGDQIELSFAPIPSMTWSCRNWLRVSSFCSSSRRPSPIRWNRPSTCTPSSLEIA